VLGVKTFVTCVAINGFAMEVQVGPKSISECVDRTVQWEVKFAGKPNQIDLAKSTEGFCERTPGGWLTWHRSKEMIRF
jgi:hypothetical protein